MTTSGRLDLARQLVAALEAGSAGDADRVLQELNAGRSPALLRQIAQLTREVHQAFGGLISDEELNDLTKHAMPDARERLAYVTEKTEEAAHRTLAAVEGLLPLSEQLAIGARAVAALAQTQAGAGDDRVLRFVSETQAIAARLRDGFAEVLMAQEYQDLTGQVIKRTIEIVTQVEQKLITLITAEAVGGIPEPHALPGPLGPQGPAIRASTEVISRQNDVDALLADLGV